MQERLPADQHGWAILCSRLIDRRLKEAGLSQVELVRRLHQLGATQAYPTISAKIARGTFPAGFLIQAMVATGASAITLPTRGDPDEDGAAAFHADVSSGGDHHILPVAERACADKPATPTSDAGWQSLAARTVGDTLARAGVSRADLFWLMRRSGIQLDARDLGQRLRRGNYRAQFMLQVLVALGCRAIELPAPPTSRGGAGDA